MSLGVQGEGVFLGKPEDSVWEDWGILGKIRGITTPALKNPIKQAGATSGDTEILLGF